MKTPDIESLKERLLSSERTLNAALEADFGIDSCLILSQCLMELWDLVLDEAETLPVIIQDESSMLSKVLVTVDVAYCCWMNDEPAVELPGDVVVNHSARMHLNRNHRERVLEFTRMFLKKHGKLMSVELASLRLL